MKFDVKVPAVGESITEATIGSWSKKNGEAVKRNDVLLLLETDKASVEIVAENDGVLQILKEAGQTIPIGSVIGMIDTEGAATSKAAPAAQANTQSNTQVTQSAPSAQPTNLSAQQPQGASAHPDLRAHLSPAVQKIVTENNLNPASITGTGRGGRLTKEDAMGATSNGMNMVTPAPMAAPAPQAAPAPAAAKAPAAPTVIVPRGVSKQGDEKRVPMTTIRKKIAERLVQAQHTAAILTTFNEVDMTRVMEIRNKYKDRVKEKYGVGLGFMGFFVKSCIEALKEWPAVNGTIEGTELVYKNYFNIGVAVGTEKGLIVPVIKDADQLSIWQIEASIKNYALKARDGKISIDDLSGGTFTISNGGVYGSLMSTPILNAPQSGILGMHKIQDRPMAINGKVEIRPMMYIALSYDHRIIDGKEAVSFLVRVKEGIEDPERLLLEV